MTRHPATRPVRAGRLILGPIMLLMLALAIPGPAHACRLQLRNVAAISFSGSYDGFATAQPGLTQRFDVVNSDADACSFGVGIDQGQYQQRQMIMGSGRLSYELRRADNATVADAPATAANGLITGSTTTSATTASLVFYASLPAGQIVPPGSYTDQVTVRLYELTNGQAGRQDDMRTVPVSATAAKVATVNAVVGGLRTGLAGMIGTLDFGTLTTGESMAFSLEVLGNSGYDVVLQSANSGSMAGTDADNRSSRVPYSLAMDGSGAVSLVQPLQVPERPPTDFGRTANDHLFLVTIGDIGQALAGRYADSITVTVTTR